MNYNEALGTAEPDLMGESNEEHYELPQKPTPRAYALRRLLEDHQSQWIDSKKIFSEMALTATPYEWELGSNFAGSVGKDIQEDVYLLNMSGEFDRIVISRRGGGYKLATKEEFYAYYESESRSNRKSLWKLSVMKRNADRDGQGIIPDENHPYQREFHDSFVRGKNEETRR